MAVLQDGDQGDERGEQKRRVHAVATQHVLAQMARDVFATDVRHVRECLRYEKPSRSRLNSVLLSKPEIFPYLIRDFSVHF